MKATQVLTVEGDLKRLPTGPLRLKTTDDWPGIFIRGDETWLYVGMLKDYKRRLEELGEPTHYIDARIALFDSCMVDDNTRVDLLGEDVLGEKASAPKVPRVSDESGQTQV